MKFLIHLYFLVITVNEGHQETDSIVSYLLCVYLFQLVQSQKHLQEPTTTNYKVLSCNKEDMFNPVTAKLDSAP